jgi:alkyl hydroperoxide reductase subunit AhpF
MALLSTSDEQRLREHLSVIDRTVTVLLFTQTIGASESTDAARQVLAELARLSDRITIEERNFVLDVADRTRYGVERSPAIVFLSGGEDTRMRMYGAPIGYEFVTLVEAVIVAGSGAVDLQDETRALISSVESPTGIQVFTTPT